jgi:lysophospholipase L1-like esterase
MTLAEEAFGPGPYPGPVPRPLALVDGRQAGPGQGGAGVAPEQWSFRQWREGAALVRAERETFAAYWRRSNAWALADTGPLWVALGDSAAQGLGARHPHQGYVGQALVHLVRHTGRPWRVVNLSRAGATIPEVLDRQLPTLAALPGPPDLVTCGVGTNDLLRLPPPRIRVLAGSLIGALPDNAVMLDVPLPRGRWRIGWFGVPYVARLNQALYAAAASRQLPVAYVSRHFTPPWAGKFGPDNFHPSATGYQDWSRAVLQAVRLLRSTPGRYPR